MRAADFGQRLLNTRAAVSLAAVLVDLDDPHQELLILLGARAELGLTFEPVVITTGRNLHSLTQPANGMLDFHSSNPLVALVGASERIPKVFFRISRCWRR